MYADILPFLKLPASKSIYTYEVPAEMRGTLVIGQFVKVSFRKKQVFGVIIKLHSTNPNFKYINPIEEALEETPSWNKAILQSLFTYAKRSYFSPSTLAKTLSPNIPKKSGAIKETELTSKFQPPKKEIEEFVYEPKERIEQVIYTYFSQKIKLMESLLNNGVPTLILTPNYNDAQELYSTLKQSNLDPILWDPTLAKNSQWSLWQKIKTSGKVVIATRNGLFLPLQNCKQIIIDQSDKNEHKSWEASPHYDVRLATDILAKELGARLISFSRSPRMVNTVYKVDLNLVAPIESVQHEKTSPLLHPQIEEHIAKTCTEGISIILSNSASQASTLHCLDCHYQWECSKGHGTLTMKNNALACNFCQEQQALPTACPECTGQRVKAYGYGAQGLYADLKQTYDSVHYVDAKMLDELPAKKISSGILIMTPYLLKRLYYLIPDLPVKSILYLYPETALFLPDYRANEWLNQSIQWHRAIASEYFGQELVIQTKLDRTNQLWDSIVHGEWKRFNQQELLTRKKFAYPPFSRLISLTYRYDGKTDQKVINDIQSALTASQLTILGPRETYKKNKLYSLSWVIKQVNPKDTVDLDKILKTAYSRVIVDINPTHIF
jgi:primosomal protein N'